MELQPIGSKLIVNVKEVEEKTVGGILLPTAKGQKQQTGTVIAAGEGHMLEDGTRAPLSIKVGDEVIFAKFAGTEVQMDGSPYFILDEKDIYAKVVR